MQIVKILAIEEPKLAPGRRPSHWNCFIVTIDYGDGRPIKQYMSRQSYQIFRLEQELLTLGTPPSKLEEYRAAVHEEAYYDGHEAGYYQGSES